MKPLSEITMADIDVLEGRWVDGETALRLCVEADRVYFCFCVRDVASGDREQNALAVPHEMAVRRLEYLPPGKLIYAWSCNTNLYLGSRS